MAQVFLGMSGGVDSSAAAVLLQEQGYAVSGLHLSLLSGLPLPADRLPDDGSDARAVASLLGLPFYDMDLSPEFRATVIDYFIREYEAGRTPNPCVFCNRRIKFGAMWDAAQKLGADYLATGHYAKIRQDPATGRHLLCRGADRSKDQSYFLCRLTQEQLSRTLFPLGDLEKSAVRALAEAHGLINAQKRDSQDICFVPDGDYVGFMEQYTGKHYPAGDYLDLEGNKVGTHEGAVRYTIGQRRGLRLPMGDRVYVCGKDMEKNTVTVGPESALFASRVIVRDMNWISVPELTGEMRVKAKLRYRQKEQPAVASPLADGRILLTFDEAQRAPAVGQAAVLYDGDTVVGGGTICAVPADTADCV